MLSISFNLLMYSHIFISEIAVVSVLPLEGHTKMRHRWVWSSWVSSKMMCSSGKDKCKEFTTYQRGCLPETLPTNSSDSELFTRTFSLVIHNRYWTSRISSYYEHPASWSKSSMVVRLTVSNAWPISIPILLNVHFLRITTEIITRCAQTISAQLRPTLPCHCIVINIILYPEHLSRSLDPLISNVRGLRLVKGPFGLPGFWSHVM